MDTLSISKRWSRVSVFQREFILGFILILLVRLVGADFCSLWFDEVFTIKIATYPIQEIRQYVMQDPHPAYYYYTVHCLMKLIEFLGIHQHPLVWLRLTSILPNVAVAIILYDWAARRWGHHAGLGAMLAAGFSSGMLYYSIELRSYSLAMLSIFISTLALIKLVATPSTKWLLLYTMSTVTYLNVHYLTWAIYFGQITFLIGRLAAQSRRRESEAWLRQLFPHLLVVGMLLFQIREIYTKYQNYYAPYSAFLYKTRLSDLITLFTYDFPDGTVHNQHPFSWYGWTVQLIVITFYLALGWFIKRGRLQARVSPEDLLVEELCGWLMISFLGGTWLISVMRLGSLFAGYREAMLVLPLWFLFILTTIETRLQPRPRTVFRWVFVVLLLPGAIYGVYRRSTLLDDFASLNDYARQNGMLTENGAQATFFLDDLNLLPWAREACPKLKLESLNCLVASSASSHAPLRLITHSALDVRLRSPQEAQRIEFVRKWGQDHNLHIKRLLTVELLELPEDHVCEFIRLLKQNAPFPKNPG